MLGSRPSDYLLDHSTVDWERIRSKRRLYKKPPSYQLYQYDNIDTETLPPGHPRRFMRRVVTRHGGQVRGGPIYVLRDPEDSDKLYSFKPREPNQDSPSLGNVYWKPLPLEHPRTQLWIRSLIHTYPHNYIAPLLDEELRINKRAKEEKHISCNYADHSLGKYRDLDFEVQYAQKHKCFDKWRPEYQEQFIREIKDSNKNLIETCLAIATAPNHVINQKRLVSKFYPEFVLTEELLEEVWDALDTRGNLGTWWYTRGKLGTWWYTMSRKPEPHECPGYSRRRHPSQSNWCELCGWVADAADDTSK